ncbi:MAG: hypothetical protein KDD70_09270 [Bdellovibrionales bacterium]|nr:hypothetical protein [Bdellovibrionales bacterium]
MGIPNESTEQDMSTAQENTDIVTTNPEVAENQSDVEFSDEDHIEESSSTERTAPADESVVKFLLDSKKHLSEETRFHKMRLLTGGLFVDERALSDLLIGYQNWYKGFAEASPEVTLPTDEKLKKRLFQSLNRETKYLLDGKVLLCGRLLELDSSSVVTQHIARFSGSLLEAVNYIHMRDPIFEQTNGVTAHVGAKGLVVEFQTRKQPIAVDNAGLQKLARVLQQSRSIPKRFSKIQFAARQAVPAFCEIWKKAQVIPNQTKLLVPMDTRSLKKGWFLIYGDIVIVQGDNGELISLYGLRGKNLHEFLIRETDSLRAQQRRPRFGSMSLSAKGRGYGFIKLEGDSYLLDPTVVRKFIERMPYSREIPEKVPARFTLFDALKRIVALIESTAWVDVVHVPRGFITQQEPGTNYRAKGPWIIAINKKKQIVGIYDKTDPANRRTDSQHSTQPLIGIGSIKHRNAGKPRGSNPERHRQEEHRKDSPMLTPIKSNAE